MEQLSTHMPEALTHEESVMGQDFGTSVGKIFDMLDTAYQPPESGIGSTADAYQTAFLDSIKNICHALASQYNEKLKADKSLLQAIPNLIDPEDKINELVNDAVEDNIDIPIDKGKIDAAVDAVRNDLKLDQPDTIQKLPGANTALEKQIVVNHIVEKVVAQTITENIIPLLEKAMEGSVRVATGIGDATTDIQLSKALQLLLLATEDDMPYKESKRPDIPENKKHNAKARTSRTAVLFAEILDVANKGRCDTGKLNTLFGFLEETYHFGRTYDGNPGQVVKLIKNMPTFLQEVMQNALGEQLLKLEIDEKAKWFLLWCWARNCHIQYCIKYKLPYTPLEDSESRVLTAFWEGSKKPVEAALKQALQNAKREAPKATITATVDAAESAQIPERFSKAADHMQALLWKSPKEPPWRFALYQKALDEFKNCQSIRSVEQNPLLHLFARIEDLYREYQEMGPAAWSLEIFEDTKLLSGQSAEIMFAALYQAILQDEVPDDTAFEEIAGRLTTLKKKMKESGFADIRSFFGNIFAMEDPDDRQKHWDNFTSEKKKFLLKDDEIIALGNFFMQKEILDPYPINRVFLHALLVHPTKWSDAFYTCYKTLMENMDKPSFRKGYEHADLLMKSSYPPCFIDYLKLLSFMREKDIKTALVDEDNRPFHLYAKNSALALFFLIQEDTKHTELTDAMLISFIQDADQLAEVLEYLDKTKYGDLITKLGDTWLKENIQNGDQLAYVLRRLDKTHHDKLIETLGGIPWLKENIQNGDQLAYVLEYLDKEKCWQLITKLGDTWLKDKIQNAGQLANMLGCLDKANHWQLIITLGGIPWIKEKIQNAKQLATVLYSLDRKTRQRLIEKLGIPWLKEKIQNGEQLSFVLHYLDKTKHEDLIVTLGDELQTIIQDASSLVDLLRSVDKAQHDKLITTLGDAWLQEKIQSAGQLAILLEELPPEKRWAFMHASETFSSPKFKQNKAVQKALEDCPKPAGPSSGKGFFETPAESASTSHQISKRPERT